MHVVDRIAGPKHLRHRRHSCDASCFGELLSGNFMPSRRGRAKSFGKWIVKTTHVAPETFNLLYETAGQHLAERRHRHFGEALLRQCDRRDHFFEPGNVPKKALLPFGQTCDTKFEPS